MDKWKKLYEKSREYIGPVFHAYVHWVLVEAEKRGIHALYFLARDGYVLREIAAMQCKARHMDIACKYLYCSRASLRMPAYHLIGDEAYDLIFLGGYHVSVSSFLERAGITSVYWDLILKESEIRIDPRKELAYSQIPLYREKLKKSRTFRQLLLQGSKESCQAAVGYFRQEGLMEQPCLAIVDSGWTGSMQRSLRQLLESAGYYGKITGFYFGLFRMSQDARDGEYLAWYFTPWNNKRNKILFNNNLLECFLSAPHGMTVSYEKKQGRYVPCLFESGSIKAAHTSNQWIRVQIRGILDGARRQQDSGTVLTKAQCGRILRRIMARPTLEEARIYGEFSFCDDITERYHYKLADRGQAVQLKNTLLPLRAVRKLTGRFDSSVGAQPFWTFGTIAWIRNPLKRGCYWMNEYVAQWCRMTWKQNKGKERNEGSRGDD